MRLLHQSDNEQVKREIIPSLRKPGLERAPIEDQKTRKTCDFDVRVEFRNSGEWRERNSLWSWQKKAYVKSISITNITET